MIDGAIITGSVAAYVLRRARLRIRLYLWSLIGVAVGLSVVGNATHALTRRLKVSRRHAQRLLRQASQ